MKTSNKAPANTTTGIHDLKEIARRVVNLVVASGIKAILNFSPGPWEVPPDVKLKSVDLTVSLESLSFYLARGESDE